MQMKSPVTRNGRMTSFKKNAARKVAIMGDDVVPISAILMAEV